MATTYDRIATTTLGSTATSITFSSISSGYTDLRLAFTRIGGTGSQAIVYFNGTTGTTNYSYTTLYGSGSGTGSFGGANVAAVVLHVSGGTNVFYPIDIFSYAGSTFKTVLTEVNEDNNGSGYVGRTVGLWRSTSAITSITLSANGSGNWGVGTTATLYGILKA